MKPNAVPAVDAELFAGALESVRSVLFVRNPRHDLLKGYRFERVRVNRSPETCRLNGPTDPPLLASDPPNSKSMLSAKAASIVEIGSHAEQQCSS